MNTNAEPVISGDGSATLFSNRYGETYHSTFGALTEARHIFLHASGVAERLASGQQTRILEIGFGLGLNFLLTLDTALNATAGIDYHAFEHDLPDVQVLESMNYATLLEHPESARQLFEGLRAARYRDTIDIQFSSNTRLYLHTQNVCTATLADAHYHAIYLDAFSPGSNPECWSPAFIATLSKALANDGRLTTYSSKGSVRRAMIAAGLLVHKRPGPPGKREMLIADNRGQSGNDPE